MRWYSLCLICILFHSPVAFSQRIEIESVFQRGGGCLTENTETSLGEHAININFEKFEASLDGVNVQGVSVESCKWTARISVPRGYALVVKGGLFKGVYTLAGGTKTAIHSEIILDNREHDLGSFLLRGGGSQLFYHDSNKYVREMVGNCGGTSTLVMNSSMFIRTSIDQRLLTSVTRITSAEIPYQLVKCTQ